MYVCSAAVIGAYRICRMISFNLSDSVSSLQLPYTLQLYLLGLADATASKTLQGNRQQFVCLAAGDPKHMPCNSRTGVWWWANREAHAEGRPCLPQVQGQEDLMAKGDALATKLHVAFEALPTWLFRLVSTALLKCGASVLHLADCRDALQRISISGSEATSSMPDCTRIWQCSATACLCITLFHHNLCDIPAMDGANLSGSHKLGL